MKFSLIYIILLLFSIPAFSQQESVDDLRKNAQQGQEFLKRQVQQNDQRMFSTAQNYIRRNRYDAAIPLLEDLVSRNPRNNSYYEWLLRSYLMISQLNRADSLVTSMQRLHPENLNYRIDKANIFFRRGREDEAMRLWQHILETHPQNLNLYSQIANAMIENRLWDEAVNVYLTAIENIPNASHFYMNIANLYKNRLMYNEATDYFLKYLATQPKQQKYIFNQILAFQIPEDQQQAFFNILEEQVAAADTSAQLTLLLAQLYQRYEKYEKALNTYLKLEDDKSDGIRLIAFARAADQDSAYHIALKAYQFVIDHYPKSGQILAAYHGAVTTLFHLTINENNTEYADLAQQLIDSVNHKFPGHPETYRLSYLKGKFQLSYYFDVDKAMAIFNNILIEKKLPSDLRSNILLDKGECEIIKGQLKQSLETFKLVSDRKYAGEALIRSARVAYFQNDWELAKKYINDLLKMEGMSGDVTNDALALQLKLNDAEKHPDVLSIMAKGELLVFQQKNSEARKEFVELVNMPDVPAALKSEAYLLISRLSLALDEITTALEYSQRAVSDSSISIYADDHLYLMGVIFENYLMQPDRAFDIYRTLLENYPNSLLADNVRDRMRKINEESKESELP